MAELKTNINGLLELELWHEAFAPGMLEHVVFSAVVVQCYVQSKKMLKAPWTEL
jgi:hypothetical protein